jgi:hypothetical protein
VQTRCVAADITLDGITMSPLLRRGKSHYRPLAGPITAGWPTPVGPRVQLHRKKARWKFIPRPEFHGLIAGLAGLERKARAGAVRSHYRRRRLAAVEYYEHHFGHVPDILRVHHLKSEGAFYGTAQYKEWSAGAYALPRPVEREMQDARGAV